MKTIIVAYDKNHAIGIDSELPWGRDLPADIQFFRSKTKNQAVIMGLKTYESIGKPLPHRQNIVLSREKKDITGVTVVTSLSDAYRAVDSNKETFVIGGGQIYALALDSVDRILATEVHSTFANTNVFFPKIDMNIWQEVARTPHAVDETNKYAFDFVTYERR